MKRRVLSKTVPFHALFIKKKSPKQCRFERHYSLSSSPGCAENRGRRKFCSPIFTDFSSSKEHQKDADQGPPLAQNFPLIGGAAAQWPPCPLSPLFFAYKNMGRESTKKRKGGRPKEKTKREKRKEEEKRKEKERKKNRGGRGGGRRSTAGHQHCHRDNSTSVASSTASTPPQVTSCYLVYFPLAQPLPAFACRTWIIHVLQQMMERLVTVLIHNNQPIRFWARFGPAHWSGLGPAQFQKQIF